MIFLRHAETEKDGNAPAPLWNLSEDGKESAASLAGIPDFSHIELIFTSQEPKSIQTAEPLARKLGLEIRSESAFDEVRRGDTYLSPEEFEKEKSLQLEDLTYPAFGGETGMDALARFKAGVITISEKYPQKNILIVSHGTILNLYFADLLGKQSELPTRWKQTDFCAFGIVEDGKVLKDIV